MIHVTFRQRRVRCLLLQITLMLCFIVAPVDASATRPKVVIVRPAGRMPVEASMRIEGELTAAGFQTSVVVRDGEFDARSEVESAAREHAADAALSIVDVEKQRVVDVWVADRVTGKTLVRRLQVSSTEDQASKAMALQIVELLRASFLELLLEPSPDTASPPREPPRAVSSWASDGLRRRPRTFGLEAGPSVLHSFSGVPPNLGAVVRVSERLGARFAVRASFFASVGRATVTRPAGTAAINQAAAVAELVGAVGSVDALFRPTASVGLGVHRVDLEGRGRAPYTGMSQVGWGLAASFGLGLQVRLAPRVGLCAEALAGLMFPRPELRIAGERVAQGATPTTAAVLTMMTWL